MFLNSWFPNEIMKFNVLLSTLLQDKGLHFISPYNDLVVVAGQGTIGYKKYHFILL